MLERLSLFRGAAAAWARYLRLDADSSWAAEARTHLDRLSESSPVVDADRLGSLLEEAAVAKADSRIATLIDGAHEMSRLLIEETILARWARAEREGRAQVAARLLGVARAVGSRLAASGDWLIADAVYRIDRASGSHPAELRALAAGHEFFGEAVARERTDSYTAAARLLEEARNSFAHTTSSPFGSYAALHLAICKYFAGDYKGAGSLVDEVLKFADPSRALTLYARSLWMRGLIYTVTGEFASAIEPYRSAAEIFDRVAEPSAAGHLRGLLATTFRSLGDSASAWEELVRALRSLPWFTDSRRMYSILVEASVEAVEEGQADVALHFLDEVMESSFRGLLPGVLAEALLRRARIQLRVGNRGHAERDLTLATGFLPEIGDEGLHERIGIDLLAAKGELKLEDDARSAADLLSRALTYFRESGHQLEAAALYGQVAAAEERAGSPTRAAEILAQGISAFEAGRASLESGARQHEFFERGQSLFDRMIALESAVLHDPEAALGYAERARARTLLDLSAGRAGPSFPEAQPLAPAAIQRALPAGVTLIELAALPDRLVSWTVKRESIVAHSQPISSGDLVELCGRWRGEMQGATRSGARFPAGERLRKLIAAPLLPAIRGSRAVVFVPDRVLSGLPFAALPGEGAGRFLVDEAPISVEPSASLYVAALRRARRFQGPLRSALVVVTDGFDRLQFPGYSDLPGARREAARIARLYPASKLLAGQFATKESFLGSAAAYEVIHLAGHTLFDAAYPGSPALLMALSRRSRSPRISSLLHAEELYSLRLPGARLVVLAGCGSALGKNPTREGVMNLARPLLAAGVPDVVATLWAIDDEASSQFFERFHAVLLEGMPPVQALRVAQLELAHNSAADRRAPSRWAAFEMIGGTGVL